MWFWGSQFSQSPSREPFQPGVKNPWFSAYEFGISPPTPLPSKSPRHQGNLGLKIQGSTEGRSSLFIYQPGVGLVWRPDSYSARSVGSLYCLSLGNRAPLASETLVQVRRCPTEISCQRGSHKPCWLITLLESWGGKSFNTLWIKETHSPLRFSNIPEAHSFLWIGCGQ